MVGIEHDMTTVYRILNGPQRRLVNTVRAQGTYHSQPKKPQIFQVVEHAGGEIIIVAI